MRVGIFLIFRLCHGSTQSSALEKLAWITNYNFQRSFVLQQRKLPSWRHCSRDRICNVLCTQAKGALTRRGWQWVMSIERSKNIKWAVFRCSFIANHTAGSKIKICTALKINFLPRFGDFRPVCASPATPPQRPGCSSCAGWCVWAGACRGWEWDGDTRRARPPPPLHPDARRTAGPTMQLAILPIVWNGIIYRPQVNLTTLASRASSSGPMCKMTRPLVG